MSDLSSTMMSALGSLPITLAQREGHWFLPHFAPSGQTLRALNQRGLAHYVESAHQWQRTTLGEAVWEAR